MSTDVSTDQATSTTYRRNRTLSWRDTGRHVLVAPTDRLAGVLVLEGGSALLWRLLESPDCADGLARRLAGVEGAPDAPELAQCLGDLAVQGVLCLDASGERS